MARYGGRQPKYTCKEEIEGLIEAYFKDCEGKPLTDGEGNPVYDKFGYPVIVNKRPPTVTGLAYALGFLTRDSLLAYQGKKEFRDVITLAKTRIEMYTEERLFDRDGVNGARFSLQNNFKGWNAGEKAAGEAAPAIKIVCDIPHESLTPTKDGSNDAGNEQ